MNLNEYLAENGNWIGAHSTAALVTLAPAEWRAVVIAAAQLGGAEPGIDCGGFRGTKRSRSREPVRTWVVLDLGDRRLILA